MRKDRLLGIRELLERCQRRFVLAAVLVRAQLRDSLYSVNFARPYLPHWESGNSEFSFSQTRLAAAGSPALE